MPRTIADLANLGLTKGEIKIYQALIEMGESKRAELAKKSGVSPSRVYDVTNRLLEKGLISKIKKQGTIHFSAANPKRLQNFMDNKVKEAERGRKLVEEVLPTLLKQYNEKKEGIDVGVYYGWDGLKTAYITLEEAIGKNDEGLVFGASVGENPDMTDVFIRSHQQRLEDKGCKMRIIFNEDVRKRKLRYEYYIGHKRHEIRFLHQATLTELNIYKDYVLITILLKQPVGILIKSKEAVDSFTKFFNSMWEISKR